MKLALLTNIPSPYRVPLFNTLSGFDDIELHVIFFRESDPGRKWRINREGIHFSYRIIPGICLFYPKTEMVVYLNWGMWSELRRFDPDIICCGGYAWLASLELLMYAKLKHKPIFLFSGSILGSGKYRNSFVKLYKKFIIPKFDAYITYGTAAKDLLVHFGANPKHIIVGINTVDTKEFSTQMGNLSSDEVAKEHHRFKPKNILYVGQFIQRKGVMNLIKAFVRLDMPQVGLILVGNGPEKENYLQYIKTHNIKNVFIEPFVQKEKLPKYYAISDVFVLPSHQEVWGLVINEAMACGLPILSSKVAGATRDLVKEGENGYGFDPNDVDNLVEKLKVILYDNNLRCKMGKRSAGIIKEVTPKALALRFREAAYLAMKCKDSQKWQEKGLRS